MIKEIKFKNLKGKTFLRFSSVDGIIDFKISSISAKVYYATTNKLIDEFRVESLVYDSNQSQTTVFQYCLSNNPTALTFKFESDTV
jgi:hypothetical protein